MSGHDDMREGMIGTWAAIIARDCDSPPAACIAAVRQVVDEWNRERPGDLLIAPDVFQILDRAKIICGQDAVKRSQHEPTPDHTGQHRVGR